ncbi:MAG: hypothetical protein HYZ63_04175 [Candidatus Andersenbacteria bacterium]|nr:hypothetical protein [Candidatus Andersenbacteria bacterium]
MSVALQREALVGDMHALRKAREERLSGRFARRLRIAAFVGALGSGKTSIIKAARSIDSCCRLMRSVTTRPPRFNRQGNLIDEIGEYEYVSDREFDLREKTSYFAWATPPILEGNRYGTMYFDIELAVNLIGHLTFMHLRPESVPDLLHCVPEENLALFFVTVHEPSILRGRLKSRGEKMSAACLETRFQKGQEWQAEARDSGLPYRFIDNSGHLDTAVANVVSHLRRPGRLS